MKGENIATRLLVFGAGVVRLCRRLPDDASAKHIAQQLVRAATGGGQRHASSVGQDVTLDAGLASVCRIRTCCVAGISANLVSTRRVDHERSGAAISGDRIGNTEAEPGT